MVIQGTEAPPVVSEMSLRWWRIGTFVEGSVKVRLRISATVIAMEIVLPEPNMTMGVLRSVFKCLVA